MLFLNKRLRQSVFFGLLVASYHNSALCEDENLLKPTLSVSGYSSGSANFEDNENENFKDRYLGMTYFLPVGSGNYGSSNSGVYQSFINFKYFSNRLELSTLDEEHRVHDANIGGGALLLSGGSANYLFAGGVNLKGEGAGKNSGSVGGGGFAGGIYTVDDLSWIYGGAFGYSLGKGAFFPVLGLNWKINENSSFLTILPVLFQYSYHFTEKIAVNAFLGMKGNQYTLDLSEDSSGLPDSVDLRIFQIKVGGKAVYSFSKNWAAEIELGKLSYRKLSFYDGSRELSSEELEPSRYIMLKATYRFGKTIYEKILSETSWQ